MLYQRGTDGFPTGSDQVMRKAYGQIPAATQFQKGTASFEVPKEVHGWVFSTTFNRWSAFVTFEDGTQTYTYPKTW